MVNLFLDLVRSSFFYNDQVHSLIAVLESLEIVRFNLLFPEHICLLRRVDSVVQWHYSLAALAYSESNRQ